MEHIIKKLDENGLQTGDDAMIIIYYLNGYFSYPSSDPRFVRLGVLIEPGAKRIVKFEDVFTVLSSSTYRDGGIAIVSLFKREAYQGGFKLIEVPVVDFPPVATPASLNDEQMVQMLIKLKKSKTKKVFLDYIKDNGITSHMFVVRLLGIAKDIELPHSVMLELTDIEDKLHHQVVTTAILESKQEKDIEKMLKKAGYK